MGGFGQTPLLYDWAGKPTLSDTSAAPVSNRPGQALYTASGLACQGGLLALGSDYGSTPKAQVPRVDGSGNVYVTGANTATSGTPLSSASAAAGPIVMGLSGLTPTPLQIDALQNLVVMQDQLPTFSCVAAGVAITTGKSMLALVNGSTGGRVLRLVALYVVNSSTTTSTLGNTYNIYAGELRPITGVSATGTTQTIVPHDSSDTLDGNVKVYSGATVTGDTQGAYRRWITSNFGLQTNATNAEAQNSEQQGRFPWVQDHAGSAKPIVVRPGAGLHVKIASTATIGFLDVTCVFTQAIA